MTLLGSNCWVSLHIMKRGVLRVSCLVPLPPPSLPPLFGKWVLYFISTDLFGQCDCAGGERRLLVAMDTLCLSLMCLASPFSRVPSPNLIYC